MRNSCRWFELLLARLRKFEDFTKLWRKTDDQGYRQINRKYQAKLSKKKVVTATNPEHTFMVIKTPTLDERVTIVTYVPQVA